MNFLISLFTYFLSYQYEINLNPGEEKLETLYVKLKGNGKYEFFIGFKNDSEIKIEYGIDGRIFEPINSFKKIDEGIINGEKRFPLFLKFFAPFNLPPKEYMIKFSLWTKGNAEIEVENKRVKNFSENSKIIFDYFLKERIKAGEKLKIKGKLEIFGELKRGIIKLRLPYEILYVENSFYFNGIKISPILKNDELLFEIKNIGAGSYDFEYIIFAREWIQPKIVFTQMGIDAWIDEEYIEYPKITKSLFVEADIFYEGGIILGRVYDKEKKGIEGIKIFLEDGSKVITDKDGKYSFRYVKPGTHVLCFKNYKKIIYLPPGGVYLLDFEIERKKIGPKREYVFITLGEIEMNNIFKDFKIDGKLNLYFLGEIEGNVLIEALFNTLGKEPSEIGYLIRPDEKYKVFADRSYFDPSNPGKFYIMIKKEDEYLNAGFIDSENIFGIKIKKKFSPLTFSTFTGFPNFLIYKEEFLISTKGPYKLKRKMVIINSERVYLEIRDFANPKNVLKREMLIRDRDYEFNYKDGEIWLKDHIIEEGSINPRFIVVEYNSYPEKKEFKDLNFGLRNEFNLSNLKICLNFDRAGSSTVPYHSISIDENINYKFLNLFSNYSYRIEKVENGYGYRAGFNLKLYKSKIEFLREYMGKGIVIPYPGYIPLNRESNSFKGDFDLHFKGLYLSPSITNFKEGNEKIHKGIAKEIEFGWRSFYNQRAFIKLKNARVDDEEYFYIGIGYSFKSLLFSPFYRWSKEKKFIGGFFEIGEPEKIKFNLEEEYGFNLYHKNIIGFEKIGFNNHFSFKPKIIYEKRMIDDRDYILTIFETNLFLENILINTNFSYHRYFKIPEENKYFFYRLILWPLNDFSIFSEANFLNKKFKLIESGFAYRPLFKRSIALLGGIKYEDFLKGEFDFLFSPLNQIKILIQNAFGKNLKYNNLRFEIIPFLNIGVGIDFGRKNGGKFIGGEIFYEFSGVRLGVGYKDGFNMKIGVAPIKYFSFGIEENALEMLDKFLIEIPSIVTIDEEFEVKIIATDKKGEIFEDFIGEVEFLTKASKRRIRFKEEDKGKKIFKLVLSNKEELGANYIIIKDRKGRISKKFFYLKKKDEIISYEEVKPYLFPEPEYLSHFIINVPNYAKSNEPFIVEIIAMSNKNRVFEEFTNGIEILTSNKENVKPNKFYFTKEDKGRIKVTLIYPGKGKIRLLVRPIGEPLKVSISEPIVFK
jgi:hypothetical protein